jgi:hypothetical protein
MLPAADIPYRMEQSFFPTEDNRDAQNHILFVSCVTYLFRFPVI